MKPLLFLLVPAALFAVDGTVINQTTGKPQANVIISLIQPGQGGMATLGSAKTDTDGKFTIDKPTGDNPALLQALYGGVTYTKMLQPGAPPTGVEVAVFDASNKPGTIELNQHMVLLQPGEKGLQVNEMYLLRNTSKTTFNDPAQGSLQFFAPAGHGEIKVTVSAPGGMPVQRPAQSAGSANTLKVDFPVKPGETRFDIFYAIEDGSKEYSGKTIMKGGETRLVVPDGVTLEGAGVEQLGAEPQTKAKIYGVKTDNYTVKVSGTGSLNLGGAASGGGAEGGEGAQSNADDEGRPEIKQTMPRIYDKLWIVLGLSGGILLIGFLVLYRSNKA